MIVSCQDAVAAAKSFTELAIQHNLINSSSSTEETSKEIAKFYLTIYEELSTDGNN